MEDLPAHLSLGLRSEHEAGQFLQTKGLKPIINNYRCPYGEIDLIMQEGDVLVFIEVRSRNQQHYGGALESIDRRKRQKLLKSVNHYLQKHQLLDKIDCRMDVIGFSNNAIEWIKDAFSYE